MDSVAIYDGAKALFAQKNYSEAKRLLSQIQDDPTVGGDARGLLGLIALAEHDVAGADIQFKKAIELDPLATQPHIYMGELHIKRKDFMDARKEFEIVRELDPKHQIARQRLAELDDIGHQREEYRGDIYDLLRASGDDFSIAAIRKIDETRLTVHGLRLRAYRYPMLKWIAALIMILLFAGVMFLIGYSNGVKVTDQYQIQFLASTDGTTQAVDASGAHPPHPVQAIPSMPSQPNPVLQASYARALAAAHVPYYFGLALLIIDLAVAANFIYWIVGIKRTDVTIDRGYITVEEGVFTRTTRMEEIYRANDFSVSQFFLNQSCNEGALILNYENGRFLRLRGLAPADQLIKLARDLRSLHLQLRSTNIGKGVLN